MAIVARALRRLPLHLSPSLARPFCAVSPVAAAAAASAKVADRIVRVLAIDLDGRRREVVGLVGQTLLRALANAGLIEPASHHLDDIDACSAECEVHIAQECFISARHVLLCISFSYRLLMLVCFHSCMVML